MGEPVSSDVLIAGRYRLESEVGRGGMGLVWQAYDELLHRSVAVKEVRFPADLPAADRERLAGRTLREARAVAQVDTPAAVRVFDIVEQDGRPWIVMELVRGGTLTDLLRERSALPAAEVARIGLSVLEALEAAHAAGVLHRDVKPSNILIGDDGRVALTDFGIATVDGDSSAGDTTSGVIVGSPAYIAPERAHGHQPTAASDLWSLGATLWTAAEGRPPYEGPTAFAVMSSVTTADAPPCTRCGGPLAELLRGLMDRDPEERPTAPQVRAALTEIVDNDAETGADPADSQPTTSLLPLAFDRTTVLDPQADSPVSPEPAPAVAAPVSPPPPPARPSPAPGHRRFPFVAGAAVLALAVVAAVIVAVLTQSSGKAHPSAGSRHGKASAPPASSHPSASAPASTASAALPTGWTRYTDPQLHWSIGVPPGWTRSATSSGTQFSDPAGGRYVLIATRYPAGSSAVAAWRDSERSFRASHASYQRVTLGTIQVAGAKDAADWEFTYADGGAELQALDRAEVFGTRGYAVYEQSHSDQWAASQRLFDQVMKSFHHGSTGA
jgi:serine/threonine protein kinase